MLIQNISNFNSMGRNNPTFDMGNLNAFSFLVKNNSVPEERKT